MSLHLSNASESPAGEGQEPGRRETLTSRAQRIIGRGLDDPKEPRPISAKRGPPKKSPTRRREQVLAAQRTHRQRTQGYIKELEKEVLRLRGVEDTLRQENRNHDKNIRMLQQVLQANNIPMPQDFYNPMTPIPSLTPFSSPSARDSSASPAVHVDLTSLGGVEALRLAPIEQSIEVPTYHSPSSTAMDSDFAPSIATYANPSNGSGSTTGVTVDLTTLATIGPIKWCGQRAAETPPLEYVSPATFFGQQGGPDINMPPPTLDSQEAIDFILELEKPCLPHVKFQYEQEKAPPYGEVTYNAGPGHVFMATTALVNSQGLFDHATSAPFELPRANIDQLFYTSMSIDFMTDVTPVQIWANIVRICASRNGLSRSLLRAITDEFNKYVRCNSFGAVVEKSTASQILGYFFPGEQFIDTWI